MALELLVTAIKEKEAKGIQMGKEVKLSLQMTWYYIQDPENTTRKLLNLINKFSKVPGYKINTQKSVAFLCTNNERSEREIWETISFTITSKRIKCLPISLSK